MDSRIFRDESGRMYQATNDEYALPADDAEVERLNVQHQAIKYLQGNKNYLAPIDSVLKAEEGVEKRVLDIGCGSGVWTHEIALEFPHVHCIGNDLVPVQCPDNMPDNLRFELEDVTQGLSYPDAHFDVIHSRLMLAGIRDWDAYLNECIRLLKPGRLVVFYDMADCFRQAEDIKREDLDKIAPAFAKWSDLVEKSMDIRHMNVRPCLKTIPDFLLAHQAVSEVRTVPGPLPLTPWSDAAHPADLFDPIMRKTGEMMLPDTEMVPSTLQLLVTDACEISDAEYNQLAKDMLKEFENKDAHPVAPLCHVWAFKL